MPNNCNNRMTVVGDKKSVDKFVSKANGPIQKYLSIAEDKSARNSVLSFHQLIPIPDDILNKDYTNFGYYVEHALWGVKWGAYEESLEEHIDGKAIYNFTTAWCPPVKFLETISTQFPTLYFYISFNEESPSRGKVIYHKGISSEELHEDSFNTHNTDPYPQYDEDRASKDEGYDNEHWELASKWRNKYFDRHDEWVNNHQRKK